MARNAYPGQDPAQRERDALYAASSRVGQPAQPPPTPPPAGRTLGTTTSSQPRGRTSYQPGMGPAYANMAAGVGADIAGRQVTNQLMRGGTSALTGSAAPAWASGAAGMGAGIGINMAGNYLAEKHRVKEDPISMGNHQDLIAKYGRRMEGTGGGLQHGAIKGATMGSNPALLAATGGISAGVGALAGLATAALTKNAKSAYTDLSVQDGEQALRDAYKNYLGRDASDEEVMGRVRGQGWKEGQRWMGQNSLLEHMDEIQGSAEAQAYRARQDGAPPEENGSVSTMPLPAPPAGSAPGAGAQPRITSPGQSYAEYQNSRGGPQTGMYRDPNAELLDTQTGQSTQPFARNSSADRLAPPSPAPSPAPSSPGGAPVPPPDAAGWNTDGYGAPASIAQNFRTQAPSGWDQEKWNNANHQTPKYVWGRITQDDDPNDIEQLLAAYPGAQFNGKDRVTGIPGLGPIDVYKGASTGLNEPQWYDINAAEAEGGQGGGQGGGMPMGPGGPLQSSQFLQMIQGQGGGRGYSSDAYSALVQQYLLQGLGLDRAAARLER